MTKKQNIDVNQLKKKLQDAEFTIKEALKILSGENVELDLDLDISRKDLKRKAKKQEIIEEEKIIEGVFDGQNMIGPDEKMYPVPANYASKSKLIEGDVLKLTISEDGTFIFKQIGPIERNKMIGQVKHLSPDEYIIESEDKTYKILLASATYFKLEDRDTVTIVVPKEKKSTWAAIENVIKKAL